MPLHMIKLCVGCDTVQDLIDWHAHGGDEWIMRTRQTPKRAVELMDGGSLYRVIKGMILCHQKIELIETVGEGVNARCEVTVSPEVVLTAPTPRRAFQGWRYLQGHEAPMDLSTYDVEAAPPELARQLREIGAW